MCLGNNSIAIELFRQYIMTLMYSASASLSGPDRVKSNSSLSFKDKHSLNISETTILPISELFNN